MCDIYIIVDPRKELTGFVVGFHALNPIPTANTHSHTATTRGEDRQADRHRQTDRQTHEPTFDPVHQ